MKWIKLLVLMLLVASLVWFASSIDPQDVLDAMSMVGLSYFWVILATATAYILGAIAWRLCIDDAYSHHLKLRQLFAIRLIGEAVTLVNPSNFIGGESTKAYLLQKRGIPYTVAFSSVILSRTILIIVQVLLFVMTATSYMVISERFNQQLFVIILISIIVPAILVMLLILTQKTQLLSFPFTRGQKFLKFKASLQETFTLVRQHYQAHRGKMALVILIAACHWMAGSVELYLLFSYLGVEISYHEALMMDMGIILLKSFGVFVPGQIGIEEYSNKILFAVVGMVNTAIWISISLLRRLRQLIWIVIGLLLYLFMEGKHMTGHIEDRGAHEKLHQE